MGILYYGFYVRYDAADEYEDGLSRRLLEYSVPLTATQSANVIDKQIDIVLVGAFINPAAVAFYTLAKQITEFVLAPAASLGFTISPNFGEQKAAGRTRGSQTDLRDLVDEHPVALFRQRPASRSSRDRS